MDAATGCPTGDHLYTAYEEMFTSYFDMVKQIVIRAGILPLDVEDVAMEIITTFIKKEGIENYDPHRTFNKAELHGANKGWSPLDERKKATFKGMLRGFARVYVMAWRDKQMMKAKREPLRLEKQMDDGTEWGSTLVEESNVYENIDIQMSIRNAVEAARFELSIRQQERDSLKPKKNSQRRDLIACFDLLLQEGYMSGRITRAQASARLGVTESAVGIMLKEIKEVLRAEMDHLQVAMP